MNKKVLSFVFVALFAASSAWAVNADPTAGPYTTDNNSTVEKNVFTLDETPFAYIQFNSDDLNLTKDLELDYRFKHGGTGSTYWQSVSENLAGATGLLNYWNTLAEWDTVKQTGTWEIKTFWNNPSGSTGNQTYTFTVTPEPASMALFGLGAGLLGLAGFRRKQN